MSEVKIQKANNMPVQSPLVPEPMVPYSCKNSRTVYAMCEVNEETVRRHLAPTPFEYVSNLCMIYVNNFLESPELPYMDSGIIFTVKYKDMYGGKIAEKGTVDEIFYKTAHPYTAGLIKSIATLDTSKEQKLIPIDGTPPDLFAPPKGCPFAARCEFAMPICNEEQPRDYQLSEEHVCACWLQHEYAPKVSVMKGMEVPE